MRLLVVFFGFLLTVAAYQLTVIPWPAKKLSK
jgi:hypothetical protein